jgi:hypothetical protein
MRRSSATAATDPSGRPERTPAARGVVPVPSRRMA